MTTPKRRLETMKVIAAFLGKSQRTVRRLASPRRPAELRLPVWRLTEGPKARVHAYVEDLMDWEQRMAQRSR